MSFFNEQYILLDIKRNLELITMLFDKFIQDDGFICGGFVRVSISTLKEVPPCSDIDIYSKSQDAYDRIVERLKLAGYYEQFVSDVANMMKYSFSNDIPIQVIKPINQSNLITASNNIYDILEGFDFSISRIAITKDSLETSKAIADINCIEDENNKKLNIKHIHCPISEIYRISKYMKKGYWINIAEVVKVLEDWRSRDESYRNKIMETINKVNPTQEEIMELESLLRVD